METPILFPNIIESNCACHAAPEMWPQYAMRPKPHGATAYALAIYTYI